MTEDERPAWHAWGPRLLAPLAFFAAATVLILLVNSALNGGSEPAGPTEAGPGPAAAAEDTTGPEDENGDGDGGGSEERQFYRIRAGDTLDALANRFETTVDELLQLNPNIQPNNLSPGQRIRVR